MNMSALLKKLKSMHIFNQINNHGPHFNQIQLKNIKWLQIKDKWLVYNYWLLHAENSILPWA